jgi:hypothetical protein
VFCTPDDNKVMCCAWTAPMKCHNASSRRWPRITIFEFRAIRCKFPRFASAAFLRTSEATFLSHPPIRFSRNFTFRLVLVDVDILSAQECGSCRRTARLVERRRKNSTRVQDLALHAPSTHARSYLQRAVRSIASLVWRSYAHLAPPLSLLGLRADIRRTDRPRPERIGRLKAAQNRVRLRTRPIYQSRGDSDHRRVRRNREHLELQLKERERASKIRYRSLHLHRLARDNDRPAVPSRSSDHQYRSPHPTSDHQSSHLTNLPNPEPCLYKGTEHLVLIQSPPPHISIISPSIFPTFFVPLTQSWCAICKPKMYICTNYIHLSLLQCSLPDSKFWLFPISSYPRIANRADPTMRNLLLVHTAAREACSTPWPSQTSSINDCLASSRSMRKLSKSSGYTSPRFIRFHFCTIRVSTHRSLIISFQ